MPFPMVCCTHSVCGELSSISAIWVVIYSFLKENYSAVKQNGCLHPRKFLLHTLEAKLHIMCLWVMNGWELPAGSSATTLSWLSLPRGQEFVQHHTAWSRTGQVGQPELFHLCSCQLPCGSPAPGGTTARGQSQLCCSKTYSKCPSGSCLANRGLPGSLGRYLCCTTHQKLA